MVNPIEENLFPKLRVPLGWIALFLLLVAGIFNYPLYPYVDLDSSWRMGMGYFFQHNFQFGTDVVFSYGPLGFEMGKTYSGLQFVAIVIAQLAVASFGATVIIREGRRLQGLSRWAFFLCFFLFGVTYEDALQMQVIALCGFQLMRRENGRAVSIGLPLALAAIGAIKFTNLMLAGLAVAAAVGYTLWQGRRRDAWLMAFVFVGGFLTIWILCGQNPANLPAYFRTSWAFSQGYGESMGITTPWPPLWRAFVVLGVIGSYLLLHLWLNPDKPRAAANVIFLAGYIFLNWKHGFVRSDGHMIGFFFCALLPMTAYPSLLDDPPRFRRLHYGAFIFAAWFAITGIEASLYHTAHRAIGVVEDKIWTNLERTMDAGVTKQIYHDKLLAVRGAANLSLVQAEVKDASIDVLGHEQAVAIFNDFNYRPRPVFQGYAAFNPYLIHLNGSFYASDRAPDYVLLKIQGIDNRLSMMDDSEVLRMLPYRYDYVLTEKGYQLWKRLPGKCDPAKGAPRPLLTTSLPIGDTLSLAPYKGKELWLRVSLPRTLLGRLHSFLYKPPHVTLIVTDDAGKENDYYMPVPQGEAGFLLSPLVEDTVAYAAFARGRPGREARSFRIKIKPGDRMLFADQAGIELSELTPAGTADLFFRRIAQERFHMFKSVPVQYEAHVPVSENEVDGRSMIVMHAPSEMTFDMPANATEATGFFGFVPGAYSEGGDTNGAVFIIYWSNGGEKTELFRRYLDPVHQTLDRGMLPFKVSLNNLSGGRLYLQVDPGPYGNFAWDWTGWSGIDIH